MLTSGHYYFCLFLGRMLGTFQSLVGMQDLGMMVEHAPIPVSLSDSEGNILYVNTMFLNYFGLNESWVSETTALRNLFVMVDDWNTISAKCHSEGSWEGYTFLQKSGGEEVILRLNCSRVKANEGPLSPIAIFYSETNEARRRTIEHGQILRTTSICSNILIESKDTEEGFTQVVEMIGKAVRADRCYVYQNAHLPGSSEVFASLISQWSRDGIPDISDQIDFISYNRYPGFLGTLEKNEEYRHLKSDFSGDTLILMERRKTESILCLPIHKNQKLWGFMGFDDCVNERLWDEQERSALKLLTNSISTLLSKIELSEELYRKNAQLESAIRGSRESLWDYDVKEGRLYLSPQFTDLLGYKKNELNQSIKDLRYLIHPLDYTKVIRRLEETLRSGDDFHNGEVRLIKNSGQVIWISINAQCTRNKQGEVSRISGSGKDITVEKKYQQRIDESQEKYVELVDNLREVVFQLDENGKITFLNNAWKYMTGIALKKSLYRPLEDFLVNEDRERFSGMFEKLLSHPYAYLNCLVRIDNQGYEDSWAEVYARSIFRKDRKPYILGTIIDVTRKQIAEQRLKDSEEKYRLITENISDVVCLQDENRRFVYVSPSVKTVLGYQAEDLTGKTPDQIFRRLSRKAPWQKNGNDWYHNSRDVYHFYRPDGKKIWLETLLLSIGQPGEDRFIVQTTTRDITMYKEAEQGLKNALEKQKELNELKSNFISMASHEFRTPLTTISSSIQLLEEYSHSMDPVIREKANRHFQRIKTQIERVTYLMNDVLTMGRFDAGKTPFHPKKQSLLAFLQDLIAAHFSHQPDGRRISIHLNGKEKNVSFDANLMNHVLLNVITNAFKYSPGKPEPVIHLSYEQGYVELSVRDFGIGIPPDEARQVFQSFYRARNTTGIPGTGLGLVISKEFVELHKGSIRVESILHEQTTIIINLPL